MDKISIPLNSESFPVVTWIPVFRLFSMFVPVLCGCPGFAGWKGNMVKCRNRDLSDKNSSRVVTVTPLFVVVTFFVVFCTYVLIYNLSLRGGSSTDLFLFGLYVPRVSRFSPGPWPEPVAHLIRFYPFPTVRAFTCHTRCSGLVENKVTPYGLLSR